MYDVLFLTVALVAGVVLVVKLHGLRQAPSAMLVAVCLCTGFTGLSFFVAVPAVYALVGALSGIPNLGSLLMYGLITCFSGSAQALALLWTIEVSDPMEAWSQARRRINVRLAVFALVLLLMVALFTDAVVTGGMPGPSRPLDFDTVYATTPSVCAFLLTYQAGLAYALVGICWACHRHAQELALREPDRVSLRTGVRLIALGCLAGFVYVTFKVTAILAAAAGRHGPDWDWLSTIASPLFSSFGALLICSGFVYPAAIAWYERRRDFLALRPLWTAAAEADRHVLLDPMPHQAVHRLAVRDLKWRLARCIAESRDAQLAMRIWMDPRIGRLAMQLARTAGLPPEQVTCISQAATLRGALRARSAELQKAARAAAEQGLPLEAISDAVAEAFARGVDHAPHSDDCEDMCLPGVSVDYPDLHRERAGLVGLSRALASPYVAEALRLSDPAYVAPTEARAHSAYRHLALVDFPEDLRIGLNLSFYRTFAVPAIAKVLASTGKTTWRPAERAKVTGTLMYTLIEHGLDSPEGRREVKALKRMHAHLPVGDAEFTYVLAAFCVAPVRWIDARSWRPTTAVERDAAYTFYAGLARRVGIAGLPGSFFELAAWMDRYEAEHFEVTSQGRALLEATRSLLTDRLPLAPLARAGAAALLDERLLAAFGGRRPVWPARAAVSASLGLRAVRLRKAHRPRSR
ncbi:oxygenase MpaB family protein [Streptomyces sp. H27-C3]|uniref:oxygenase MpaB family protein n=1 Tax=Streptomyces sp. H27-C3 TaxID=3046305 RepID=UPI0024BB608B|nr:oxygenase MpaB family protein [Streptomyces sp. H27-C3]MDJ0465021.1 oxygenase MpaB family protein [Streptomyces sp. H27-C3]